MSALELGLRSSIVLALALAALRPLRHQPAALRHWLLAATIMLAALQPLLTQITPQIPVLPIRWTAEQIPSTAAATVLAEVTLPAPEAVNVRPARMTWIALLHRVWVVGAALGIAALVCGVLWLTWLGSRAREAGSHWQQAADALRLQLGIRQRVRIAITPHPAMLVTWGAVSPVILLPAGADAWPAERIRLVLAHEMAHLARRDWVIQLIAETGRAINWYNPLFWIACARLRRESEHACDDMVLALGISGTSYAAQLVELARNFSSHGRTWLPAPSIARPSTLERRVRAMLNPHVDRRPVSPLQRAVLVLVLIALAVPVAAVTTSAGAPAGVLRDPMGRVLPGATVRLSAIGADASHETQSDSGGAFQFGDIPDGEYMISARLPGFQTARQRVNVSPSMPQLDLTMRVGTLRETVTVRGGSGSIVDSGTFYTPRSGPTTPTCGSTELGGNLKPPMKLKDVRPRYKAEWGAAALTGSVLLEVVIGKDGKIRDLEVVSPGNADLEEEAIAAVSQWEFSPTWLNCERIEVRMFVTVSFDYDR